MSMSKQDFIALADRIKNSRVSFASYSQASFSEHEIEVLADFCAAQNPRFNRARWLGYIAGTNGPHGGKEKA